MSEWDNFLKTKLSREEIEDMHKNALRITNYNNITLELEDLYNYIAPKSRLIRFYNKIAYKIFYKTNFNNESELSNLIKDYLIFFKMLNKATLDYDNNDFNNSIGEFVNSSYEDIKKDIGEIVKEDLEYIRITIKEVKTNSNNILNKDKDAISVVRAWKKYLKRLTNIKYLYKKASYNFIEKILPLSKSVTIPQNEIIYYEIKNYISRFKLEKDIENIINKILGGLISNSTKLRIIYNHIKSEFKAIL